MSIQEHERQFRQLLDQHTGLIIKVVRSFAENKDDAEDLFQEIVLQVWLALPSYREEAKPTTWMYRVALNTALVWKRKEKRRVRGEEAIAIPELISDGMTAEEKRQNNQIIERLYKAIRELPTTKRALIVLYLDGFTYREISEVVGLSESNVGVSLNRIKKQLEKLMNEDMS